MKRLQTGAFSLVEILVTLVIIAVLAFLIMSGVGVMQKSSKQATNIANLRAIGVASLSFAADNNGNLPPHGSLDYKVTTISSHVGGQWPYSKNYGAPPLWLVSKEPLGRGTVEYAQPDIFYSPFATTAKNRERGQFDLVSQTAGNIGYIFYSLPRNSQNAQLIPDVYNDTVREAQNTPIYSEFCYASRASSESPTCPVLYLGGHVKTFRHEEINASKPRGWSDVINFFRKN